MLFVKVQWAFQENTGSKFDNIVNKTTTELVVSSNFASWPWQGLWDTLKRNFRVIPFLTFIYVLPTHYESTWNVLICNSFRAFPLYPSPYWVFNMLKHWDVNMVGYWQWDVNMLKYSNWDVNLVTILGLVYSVYHWFFFFFCVGELMVTWHHLDTVAFCDLGKFLSVVWSDTFIADLIYSLGFWRWFCAISDISDS